MISLPVMGDSDLTFREIFAVTGSTWVHHGEGGQSLDIEAVNFIKEPLDHLG